MVSPVEPRHTILYHHNVTVSLPNRPSNRDILFYVSCQDFIFRVMVSLSNHEPLTTTYYHSLRSFSARRALFIERSISCS